MKKRKYLSSKRNRTLKKMIFFSGDGTKIRRGRACMTMDKEAIVAVKRAMKAAHRRDTFDIQSENSSPVASEHLKRFNNAPNARRLNVSRSMIRLIKLLSRMEILKRNRDLLVPEKPVDVHKMDVPETKEDMA